MLTNPRADRVRSVRGLSRRQSRERSGLFVADGPQSVREAVRHAPGAVRDLYVTPAARERHADIVTAARAADIELRECSEEVLAAMSGTDAPQGLLAVCAVDRPRLADVLARRPRLLVVLVHVRDPGNAGTVIRAADAAGADAVLVTTESVDVHAPKVVRSTAGSSFHLPIVTGLEPAALLAELAAAGVRTYAADGRGEVTVDEVDLTVPHAWVMGNEAWGLTDRVREECDEVVRVPIHGLAESLNLAMAATVCLYSSARVERPTGQS